MTHTPRAELDRDLLLSGQVDHTDAARFAAASAPDSGTVEALEAAKVALEFYRDGFHVKTHKRPGLTWHPTEALLDDCGERAKDALAAIARARGEV